MIYGYPNGAVYCNWLHTCIVEMMGTLQNAINSGQPILEWPYILPVKYRKELAGRPKFQELWTNFVNSLSELAKTEIDIVFEAFVDQNLLEELLTCSKNCKKISELPTDVETSISALFLYLFGILSELNIRDDYHGFLIKKLPKLIGTCPFCGIEPLENLDGPRDPLDHYIYKKEYPFAAVNLSNLVLMGAKCNSGYKGQKNILFDSTGKRRSAFFPYSHTDLKLSLNRSFPLSDINAGPNWKYDFDGDQNKVKTWMEVFEIEHRYVSRLNGIFEDTLENFSAWCKSHDILFTNQSDLIKHFTKFTAYREIDGVKDLGYLKSAVCRMILNFLKLGDQRVISLLIDTQTLV